VLICGFQLSRVKYAAKIRFYNFLFFTLALVSINAQTLESLFDTLMIAGFEKYQDELI